MSGGPVVPSKDALRVLRSLAHSPPAALLGTAGALCGVATIHYYERRKVQRVEEILQIKRKLHSISNGRGSARLALMFEAAEKGEDFTINRAKLSRSVRRRRNSSQAKQQEEEEREEWKPFISAQAEQQGVREGEEWDAFDLSNGSGVKAEQLEDEAIITPSEDVTAPNSQWRSFKMDSHSVAMGRMMSYKEVPSPAKERGEWYNNRRNVYKGYEERRSQARSATENSRGRMILDSAIRISINANQPGTDLNPVSEGLSHAVNTSGSNLNDASAVRNPIFLDVDSTKLFGGDGLSSLQPWQVEIEHENIAESAAEESAPASIKEDEMDLYVPSSGQPPAYKAEHRIRSRYNLRILKVRQGMSLVGADRYQFVFDVIMNVGQRHGKQKGIAMLERIMNLYTATDIRSDFALAQAIFLDCTRVYTTEDLTPVIWRYVERFLRGDMPRFEVVSFLYPRCGAGVPAPRQYYYFLAHRYLQMMGKQGYSLDRQVTELRKVVTGTQMYQIEPHEHLIIPALRGLVEAGRMTAAQNLFEEMVSMQKIEVSFYTLQILVQGYARAGNWAKVKSILDDCYDSGLSVQKPYGLVGLLESTIHDYSLSQPPEKVLYFLKHSIRAYRIQPTSEITRELISLCLRHRRYDLVTNWVNMVRTEFPDIDIGTGSRPFAFDVACAWKDIDASCEDILAGCRAIATTALRDPFSKVFRSAVSEAAARYTLPRLQTLVQKLGVVTTNFVSTDIRNFHSDLKKLKDYMVTQQPGSHERLLLTNLLNQGEALRWINALFRGHLQSYGAPSRSIPLGDLSDSDWTVKQPKDAPLPSLTVLKSIIMKQYGQRDKAGQEIEHNSLRETVKQLINQGRKHHAMELIQTVYESSWAQPPTGREFDLDIFTDWMKLTWDLRSGSTLRYILWALIDASPQLKLSSQLILLARIAAPKTHLQKNKIARTEEIDEVEYLRARLKRRHWQNSPVTEQLRFDDWVGLDKPPTRYIEID